MWTVPFSYPVMDVLACVALLLLFFLEMGKHQVPVHFEYM